MNLHHNKPTRVASRLHLPAPINCLRFLATTLGASMLLFVGPFVMLWGVATSLESVAPDVPMFIFMKVLSFIILLSSGFFLIGLYGHRVIHSPILRVTAATLLSIPICFARIPFHGHRLEMPFLLAVLLLYVFLLSAFVWPVWLKRSDRPQESKTPVFHRYHIATH